MNDGPFPRSHITGCEVLYVRGRWAILHDPRHASVFCCGDTYATDGVCRAEFHTTPAIHTGPVFRYRRWWLPRSAAQAFDEARAWLDANTDAGGAGVGAATDELARHIEIQRITESL